MDSLTQAITVAAVGKGMELAYNEVKNFLSKSKELAIHRALNEQADLIRILDKKIKKANSKIKKLIEKNLQEPDTSLIINRALTGAYQYSDPLKTEVLAEMLWTRLTSKTPSDVVNQIVNECISKIEKLSKEQLNILAAAYKLEMSEDFSTEKKFDINDINDWLEGTRDEKYFYERNCIDIPHYASQFDVLDAIKMRPEDIFFLKAIGLAEIGSDSISFILRNRYINTLKYYPKLEESMFLDYYVRSLVEEIREISDIEFTDKFFRMNLNFSGLYLGEQVSKIIQEKRNDIKDSRKAKAKYNQEQYERYNAGLLSQGERDSG